MSMLTMVVSPSSRRDLDLVRFHTAQTRQIQKSHNLIQPRCVDSEADPTRSSTLQVNQELFAFAKQRRESVPTDAVGCENRLEHFQSGYNAHLALTPVCSGEYFNNCPQLRSLWRPNR